MRGGPKLMFSDKGNRSGNNHTIDITNAIDIISADIMKSSKSFRKLVELGNNTKLNLTSKFPLSFLASQTPQKTTTNTSNFCVATDHELRAKCQSSYTLVFF